MYQYQLPILVRCLKREDNLNFFIYTISMCCLQSMEILPVFASIWMRWGNIITHIIFYCMFNIIWIFISIVSTCIYLYCCIIVLLYYCIDDLSIELNYEIFFHDLFGCIFTMTALSSQSIIMRREDQCYTFSSLHVDCI